MSKEKEKTKLKTLRLSASAIKTYKQCPRKYYYTYIDKKPKKSYAHLELGNFVHGVLEDFHNHLLEEDLSEDKWGPLLSKYCKARLKKHKVEGEDRKNASVMLKNYLQDLKDGGMPDVVFNERGFNIKLENDVVIRGYIDRIDRDPVRGYKAVDYKGLALDTPMLTENGWSTMGDLKVGDKIYGSDGELTTVTAKSDIHNRPCYKITFSDNTSIVCDNVHNWATYFNARNKKHNRSGVFSAEEMYEIFSSAKEKKIKGSFHIKNHKPFIGKEINLPIEPWVLGAWLGDGRKRGGELTVGFEDYKDMCEKIKERWGNISSSVDLRKNPVYSVTCNKPLKSHCARGHALNEKGYCDVCGKVRGKNKYLENENKIYLGDKVNLCLTALLRNNNLLFNKHIPDKYLLASFEQRLELLRGLMDTDGHWHRERKRCVFVSSNLILATDVARLIRTFGVTLQTFTAKDKHGFISYRMEFTPVGFNPFSLNRKANEVSEYFKSEKNTTQALRRRIKNIEKVESVPTQCITVDATDSLYVCGDNLVVTHNTGKSKYLDEFQLLIYCLYILTEHPELDSAKGEYLALKEGKKIDYTFTRTDIERAVNEIQKVARDIREDRTWDPKPQFLCKWCDFKEYCPAMQESDFVRTGEWKRS